MLASSKVHSTGHPSRCHKRELKSLQALYENLEYKCAMRQKSYNTAPEHLSTGYGTKEECDALFQLEYMSDEERMMNDFFHNLDNHRMRALSSRRVERRFTVIEQEMPLMKSGDVVPA
ncbi:hypothetical protein EDC96DRAFT_546942 [Choanephora cucurbitarum]|nr:hypothetical protein EDC96DRAFT_546942 [Choanephora cucurbitarum]